MGDVLWIEPVIRRLAASGRQIIVHTRFNALFENYPLLNVSFSDKMGFSKKIMARLAEKKLLDYFINLDHVYEKSPHMHMLHAYQQAAGLPVENIYPELHFSPEEKKEIEQIRSQTRGRQVLVHIDMDIKKNFRRIHGIDWAKAVENLKDTGWSPVQVGSVEAGIAGLPFKQTTIRGLMVQIASSALFIGPDSGPGHLAASIGTPAVLFFGGINPVYRHFLPREVLKIIQQPCIFAGCVHDFPSPDAAVCKIVGEEGIPPCTLTSNEELMAVIAEMNIK